MTAGISRPPASQSDGPPRPDSGPGLDTVAVVVPVHDEERLLPRCLRGLSAACRAAAAAGVRVDVTLVLDACSDGSAALAASAGPGVAVGIVCIDERNVGSARAAGFSSVLAAALAGTRTGAGADPLSRLWLATTDADSIVPPDWLVGQLRHARSGADMVLGTVVVDDWSQWPGVTEQAYNERYRIRAAGPAHRHVHGANLGIRAGLYRRVGGFAPLRTGEDHALVAAVTAAGGRILPVLDLPVVTSGRPRARAPHGFSHHLQRLSGTR